MHIAICDDNIADRKQLERLLARESDKRLMTTGIFYIDSYGHETTLLRYPMIYDLFFIDITEGKRTGIDVSEKLRELGVTAPIIMCSKNIDYTAIPHELDDILHLKKPIQIEPLNYLLTEAIARKSLQRPTIEIRDEENTFYLFPEEILWAKEDSHFVTIYSTDGSSRRMLCKIHNLCSSLESYPYFFVTKKKYIVNANFLASITFQEITLKNGVKIPLLFGEQIQIKKWLKKNKASINFC